MLLLQVELFELACAQVLNRNLPESEQRALLEHR